MNPGFLRNFVAVMMPRYNKLLQSCPTLFLGMNGKILAKVVKCKISPKLNFLKTALAVVLLTNFDVIMIPCNILSSCKVAKSFCNS